MLKHSIVAGALFATVLGSGAALAGPLGINLPNTFYLDTETSYETAVSGVGSTLSGVFEVASISNAKTAAISYLYGSGGNYLMGVFTGFTVNSITPGVSATTITFTGGSIDYYVSHSNTFTNSSGSAASDMAQDSSGALWLSATPEVLNAAGDTLVITLNGFDPTVTSFDSSSAFALLDVTGGAAAPFLNTNGFVNPYLNQTPDISYQGGANLTSVTNPCGPDFGVCGSDFAKGIVVPEPLTLSLFGVGLVGAAAIRRRGKAKKA
jgi:hypothetical protein